MPPASSLIFVVIIAAWLYYAFGQWVQRRDHLATAYAMDRLTASMRLLDEEGATPAYRGKERPAQRSENRPSLHAPRSGAAPEATLPASRTAPAGRAPSGARPSVRPEQRAGTGRLRFAFLLAAVAEFAVGLPLIVMGRLNPAVMLTLSLALVGSFAWVRSGVAERAAARRSVRRAQDIRRAPSQRQREAAPRASGRPANAGRAATSSRPAPTRGKPARPAKAAPAASGAQRGRPAPGPKTTQRSKTVQRPAAAAVEAFDVEVDEAELTVTEADEAILRDWFDEDASSQSVRQAPTQARREPAAAPSAPAVADDDIPLHWEPVPAIEDDLDWDEIDLPRAANA